MGRKLCILILHTRTVFHMYMYMSTWKWCIFQECKQYIEDTEKKGYEKALVNIGGGRWIIKLFVHCTIIKHFLLSLLFSPFNFKSSVVHVMQHLSNTWKSPTTAHMTFLSSKPVLLVPVDVGWWGSCCPWIQCQC